MWQSMWKEFHKVGILNGEYEAKSKDGSKLYLAFQAVANFLPGMHLSVIRDITKTKEQDEQLLYHYELIESMDDAIIGTDLDFIITGWNRSAELMYGYKKEEVIGKSTGEILRANFQGMSLDDVRLEFSKEGKWVGEVIQKRKDGTDIFIQGSVSKLLDKNGLPKGAVSINRDISKLKKIEERLAKQESSILENQNRLAGMINSAMDGIISINKSHEIILINPSALKMFNYSANEILGQSINTLIPERFHNVHSNHIDEFGKTGVTTRTMNALGVVVGIRSNGNEFPVEASISQIEINKEKIYTIILRDLSEKKIIEDKIRENEKKLREAQRISKIGSWDWNLITNKVHWSDEMFNIFNIQKEDFDGSIETSINLFHPEDRERIKALTMKAVNEKKPQVFEARILLPDGQVRYVFGDGEMRFDELGILTYMAGTHQDITERKLAEIRIRNLLLEKEILLKEVHHRIKNNMQAIAGLLSIHSNSIENKEASEILLDAMNRINGMSILYDKLYRTTDFIEVSAKEYLSELVDKILEVNFSSKPIEIEKNIEEFNLNTKILFPLGIIINEVITNSLKYAFKSSNENKIRIETKENQNKIKIIIQDNGIGFKAKEKDSLHSGFGLKLIQILTAQLHGSYEFNTDNGTRFTLEFKLK
jgi:PAS domain S-box-containing protein